MVARLGLGARFLSATKPDKKICLGLDKNFCLAIKYNQYCFLPENIFVLAGLNNSCDELVKVSKDVTSPLVNQVFSAFSCYTVHLPRMF